MALDLDALHRFDECIDLYAVAWRGFGESAFEVDDCSRALLEADDPHAPVPREERLADQLETLAALGLLEADPDGSYRVRCRPDEDVDEWIDRLRPRFERLHDRVRAATAGDRLDPATDDVLLHGGRAYLSVGIDADAPVDERVATVLDAVEQDDAAAGVVLRASATEVEATQAVADALRDESVGDDDSAYPGFEKENAEVRRLEGNDDDLEFRLYLRPRRGGP